jgi:uncharacterized protein (TIGR02611 family)
MGLKDAWHRFRSAKPGTRFKRQFEENQQERKHRWFRPVVIVVGVAVVLVGLVALPAPGPGILIVAAGAALLARESRWIAERLDLAEVKLRRLAGKNP